MKRKTSLILSTLISISIILGAVGFGGCSDTTVTVNFVTYCQEEIPPTEYEIDDYYRKLPTPTRDGYEFLGWFSEEVGGELIKGNNKASKNTTTLYARWVANDNKIATGINYSVVIDKNGHLWTWGYNYAGRLGDGTTEDRLTPAKIMPDIKFKQIYSRNGTSHAIDVNGNLWAWGTNGNGELGDGTTKKKLAPIKIMEGTKFEKVAGGPHTLAIDIDGNLWTWGSNSYGMLGNGKSSTVTENNDVLTPTKIMNGTKFKDIAAGSMHSAALDIDGNLWVWGASTYGQLGDGVVSDNLVGTPIPKQIMQGTKFSKIYIGANSTYAIDVNGDLYAWGENIFAQLGDGTVTDKSSPVKVVENSGFCFMSTSGSCHAIDKLGNIWGWGHDAWGQLGDGETNKVYMPKQVLKDFSFTCITTESCTIAEDQEGNLWAWGYNFAGRLGDGTQEDRLTPAKIILE